MTNIPPISDGQPLTYEYIQLMVDAINNLSKTEAATNQVVEVSGGNVLPSTDNVNIVTGTFTLNFGAVTNAGKQSSARKTVTFGGKFSKRPVLTLTPRDPSTAGENEQTSHISLVIASLSASEFTCRAKRIIGNQTEKDEIEVQFIAIGPAS